MAVPDVTSMGDVMWQSNAKAITDAGVQLILSNAQDLTGHQARLRVIAEATTGRMASTLVEEDPMQAAAVKQILTGDARSDTTAVAAMAQVMAKMAQTTPPPTTGV